MKKILNVALIILIISNILAFYNTTVFGFDTGSYDVYGNTGSVPSEVEDLLKQGLGIVQVVAGFVALISIIWLGVSFMKESPQGKAESKKKIYMILIGSGLIFGASKIIEMIATTANAWQ